LEHLTTAAHETCHCDVTRENCNNKVRCAYANGFPVLAEGSDVLILRTTEGWGEKGGLHGHLKFELSWRSVILKDLCDLGRNSFS
jgi:hypothetical protein